MEGVAGVAGQARVVDEGDEGVSMQGLGQEGAGGCLPFHAQGHRLQPPHGQPAVKRP